MTSPIRLPNRVALPATSGQTTLSPVVVGVLLREFVAVLTVGLSARSVSAVANAVPLIVGIRANFQVSWPVTRRVALFVSHLKSCAVTDESRVDQSVDQYPVILPVPPKADSVVALRRHERNENTARMHEGSTTVADFPGYRSDASVVGNLVSRKVLHSNPSLHTCDSSGV